MSDAEVKDLNQISKKDIYHTPSGKYIQFIHDHSEKTFDAWEPPTGRKSSAAREPEHYY